MVISHIVFFGIIYFAMVNLKRAASMLFVGIAILAVAALIIFFARGYRFSTEGGGLNSRGILVANSAPTNAQIYVNDKFSGLTSDNIYLPPGSYDVMIRKEGYSDWKKRFVIKGEVVSRVDAQLFSANPSLTPLTNRGIINPLLSPSREKVAYVVLPDGNSPTGEETGGIFVASISSKTLGIFRQNSLLIPYSNLPVEAVAEKIQFVFSIDEKNLLVFLFDEADNLLSVLLTNVGGNPGDFFDATLSYRELLTKWRQQELQINEKILDTFKKKVSEVLKENAYLVEVSPDKSKLLYFAVQDAYLPRIIQPPLIGSVPTGENRYLKQANFYIYDSKEDKNFQLNLFSTAERQNIRRFLAETALKEELDLEDWQDKYRLFERLIWYSDSRHLVFNGNDTLSIIEYDGENRTLVYSGPFEEFFLSATPDGKLTVLTNINPKKNIYPDLYTVSIK